jgi:carbon monoxide dehydrogenase subunit G
VLLGGSRVVDFAVLGPGGTDPAPAAARGPAVWQPWGVHIEVVREVAAPPAAVWAIIADVVGTAEVIRGIDRVELVSGGSPLQVGTQWRETRTMFGREATQELTVTAVDEGRSYTVTTHTNGADLESTIRVEPGPDGSTLSISLASQSTSRFGSVMAATVGRAFEGAARSVLAQDLTDIAMAAEARAGSGGAESGGRPVLP